MAKKPAVESAPASTPEGVWQDGKFRFRLTRPIPVDGDQVDVIVLREPTTLDVVEAGNPCAFDPSSSPPTVRFDEKKQAAMISRLASIPPSSVMRMSPKDFSALGWIIADFFLPV